MNDKFATAIITVRDNMYSIDSKKIINVKSYTTLTNGKIDLCTKIGHFVSKDVIPNSYISQLDAGHCDLSQFIFS